MSQVSARYAARRVRVSGSIASIQISRRPLPSLVRACRPLARSVKPPSSMYQMASESGVSCLRYSSLEDLLAADVDGFAKLGELRQRLHVVEHRALVLVDRRNAEVREQRCLPIAVRRPASRRAPSGSACRDPRESGESAPSPMRPPRSTSHWKSERWCGTACEDTVARDELARFAPSAGSADEVVRRATRTARDRCRRASPR